MLQGRPRYDHACARTRHGQLGGHDTTLGAGRARALGERAQSAGVWHGQVRCRRTDARGARVRGRLPGAWAREQRHGRGASCDTATTVATRRQCAQFARPCTAWARPGRRMSVLAGSTGPSWCIVHLAQF